MNKKALIAIIVVVGVLAAGTLGFTVVKDILIKRDPVNHLLYSMTKSSYEAVDASYSGTIGVEKDMLTESFTYFVDEPEAMAEFVSSLISEVTFSGDIVMKADVKSKEMFLLETVNINYSDEPLLMMGMSIDGEQMAISSETLYDKSFVMSKQDLFDMIKEEGDIDLNEVDFDKYIDVFDMEKDPLFKKFIKESKAYEEIFREALEDLEKEGDTTVTLRDGKEVKCDVLAMEISIDDMYDIYLDLAEEARDDKHLKVLVEAKVLEMLNLFLESEDYVVFGVAKEDVEQMIQDVEADFDTYWEDSLDEFISSFEMVQSDLAYTMGTDFTYDVEVAIDSKYRIRQVIASTDMMGITMEQKVVYNAFGDDVKTKDLALADESVNIVDLIEDPVKAEEIGLDVVDQALTNIIEGEALSKLMADLETKSEVLSETNRQSILDLVDYFFSNKDMLKDMILNSTGF